MKRIAVLMMMIALRGLRPPSRNGWDAAWNNPKGGTGHDQRRRGVPNTDAGKGTAFGAPRHLVFGQYQLTAGIASWNERCQCQLDVGRRRRSVPCHRREPDSHRAQYPVGFAGTASADHQRPP